MPTDPNFDYQVAALRSETGSFAQGSCVLADSTFSHPSSWTYTPTQSGWYKIALKACTDRTASLCGPYQQSANTPFKLPPPRSLSVTPHPLRKASLTWDAYLNADDYVVQVREQGTSDWDFPEPLDEPSGTISTPKYEIVLDAVATTTAGSLGFADADGFQFRIQARASTGLTLSSEYSHFITVIDNPMLTGGTASGSSSGDRGQATLQWERVRGAIEYSVEFRKLGSRIVRHGRSSVEVVDHTSFGWPYSLGWPYYGPSQTPVTIQQPLSGSTVSPAPITGLEAGELYAFRLNYQTISGMVFSARDAFVWTSDELPSRTSRVGSYAFFGYWDGGEYDYTICSNTFNPNDGSWQNLIVHAFEQWEEAIPDRVTVTRRPGNCLSDGQPIDSEVPITLVRALHNEANEVFMVNTETWTRADWELAILYNGLFFCMTGGTPACVISTRYTESPLFWLFGPSVRQLDRGSVDVMVNFSRGDRDRDIPGNDDHVDTNDTSFNTCQVGSDDNDFLNYRTMVHEAGHALGLSGFSYSKFAYEAGRYEMAHPSIPGSVMNYDSRVYQVTREPNCSPHPFDVMAIEALYNTEGP